MGESGGELRREGGWARVRVPTLRLESSVGWERPRALARRFQLILVLSAGVGLVTGACVALFELVVGRGLFDGLGRLPAGVVVAAPPCGLVAAALIMRGQSDLATTDAYVRAYHERGGELRVRRALRKLAASAATLGGGAALGFEGPAMLIGSTVGSLAERRLGRRFRQDDAKVLLVAGAAAGVAAIFKAPLTGVLFALEVPYRADLARRAMLPALVAAGSAYVVFAVLVGTEPLLAVGGAAPFNLTDLGGGLLVGLLCGVLARVGAWAIGVAKHWQAPKVLRVGLAGAGLVALGGMSWWWFDAVLSAGSGYEAIRWSAEGDRAVLLLVLLYVVRAAATWLSIAGGGVGGLFVPLVTQGAIAGEIVQSVVRGPNPGLFPTVGIAAFLGAGYRTPLAGVAFVAEATGQPGFLVPALLAAAAAQLLMGGASFSPYQRRERAADIEPLTRMTVAEVMSPNPDTIDARATVGDAALAMMGARRRWAPVTDGERYVGIVAVDALAAVPIGDWSTSTVAEVTSVDVPAVEETTTVEAAGVLLRADGVHALAVRSEGRVIGVITRRDIMSIEQLVDHLEADGTETDPH